MTTREIPGFPGYTISDDGQVWSTCRGRLRLRKLVPDRKGYLGLQIFRDGQRHDFKVHKLVALTFIGPRPEGMQVRHLDGNKLNNSVDNLAYGTASENVLDQVEHGGHYFANKTHCPQKHPYDEANTGRNPSGSRRCRTCDRLRARVRYAAQKALRATEVAA